MRRTDREVNDYSEILGILSRCDALSLALIDGDMPYVLPLNFGMEDIGGRLTLYFHGAKEGHKYDVMQKNPHAAFCASCAHSFIEGRVDCASSFLYESVCGQGRVQEISGEEALHALSCIMEHYVSGKPHPFEAKHAAAVRVWKMEVGQISGKRRTRK